MRTRLFAALAAVSSFLLHPSAFAQSRTVLNNPAVQTDINMSAHKLTNVAATVLADWGITNALTQAAGDALYVPLARTVNGHVLSANVTVSKSDVGLGNADNTSDASKPVSTAQQTALDLKVNANGTIVSATKTKITYDAKGLVTSGADATTADIADSSNRRYVTDAQRTVIQNTSGTNTGDQDLSGLVPKTTTVNGHPLTSNVTVTPTDLSLVIGTNVQAWTANLDTWATKTPYAGALTITTGKTFNVTNTLTLAGTDNSTLNIGSGGTLGTAAYTSSAAYATTAQGAKADTAVQSLTVTTANGISGSFTGGTTPALSLSLGAITPSSVATGSLSITGASGELQRITFTDATSTGYFALYENAAVGTVFYQVGSAFATVNMRNASIIQNQRSGGAIIWQNNYDGGGVAERGRMQLGLDVGDTPDPGAGIITAKNGYRVNNAATTGHVLRGNGTNFVDAALAASDIPDLSATYQPRDSDLDIFASITPATGVGTFLATPTLVNLKTALTDETAVGWNLLTLANPGAVTFLKIAGDNSVSAESASAHRTSIGATTVGGNLFTLPNPGAITFLQVNADNTVTAQLATAQRTALGLGTLATQSGTFSGTSSGTNTGDQTSVSGNAGTATALQAARTINGTSFDGTANITVTAAASTLTGSTLASGVTASSLTSLGDLTALRVGSNNTTISNGTKTAEFTNSILVGDNGAGGVALRNNAGTGSVAALGLAGAGDDLYLGFQNTTLNLRAGSATQVTIDATGTKFSTGVNGDGGGLKHKRVTTGSVSAGSTALVTVTWSTAFADANYTVTPSVTDSTTSSLSLSVVHVESVTASAVTVRVLNNAITSLTGTLNVIAIHD
ncbi:MAG: trimeric autotransporter adhesin [Verrucomicrobiota bacterium]